MPLTTEDLTSKKFQPRGKERVNSFPPEMTVGELGEQTCGVHIPDETPEMLFEMR